MPKVINETVRATRDFLLANKGIGIKLINKFNGISDEYKEIGDELINKWIKKYS